MIPGPILINNFISDLNNVTVTTSNWKEWLIHKSAVIRRELARLEKWVDRNLMNYK